MENNMENGLYFIDDDFNILYYNNAVKEMYPEIETGKRCYELLACGNDSCPHCPLKNDGAQNSFYNAVRKEWITAQAADVELPEMGKCHSITFSRFSENDGEGFFKEVLTDKSKEEQMREYIESLKVAQNSLEEALKRETLYRQRLDNLQHKILDSISCGVFAYTLPDRKLLVVNDAAKEMIGCDENDDPVQTLKKFLLERVVPEDKERVSKAGMDLNKNGDMIVQDYHANINGNIIQIHSNIKYIQSADGQTYILVTMLDTTEQAILTRGLEKERKAYRDALANGSEFSFLFDVTEGMIFEEFVTAKGINLVKEMNFSIPASYDELLEKYAKVCEIEFASEEMRANFTCEGLLRAFENGTTNVITEYYNPKRDIFLRTSCLLSLDEDTGHVHASVVADDVTEIRKKDKQQREELKAAYDEMNVRMNTILDGISGGFKIIDIENGYKYTYISEGAAQLQGYTVEEFLENFDEKIAANIYAEDAAQALAEANRQVAERGYYVVKYRVPHKDGSIKWVINRGKYIEIKSTGQKFLYILMQDITDLEERNMQISNVLTMQEHMADSLGSGIFAYTIPERKVLILNQEARKMFECMGSDEKAYGMDIINKICTEDLPIVRNAVAKLISPGDSAEYIYHSDTVSGERKTFKCNTKLLSFVDGQKYILSSVTDITEQELTEIRLEDERHRYREALVLGSLGFFTVDLTSGVIEKPIYSKEDVNLTDKLNIELPVDYDEFIKAWLSDNRVVANNDIMSTIRNRKKLIDACKKGTSIIDLEYNVTDENTYYHLMVLLYKIDGNIFATFIVYDITSDRQDAKQRRSVINSLGKIYSALYLFSFKENMFTILKADEDIYSELEEEYVLSEFYDLYIREYIEPEYKKEVADFLKPENIKKALMDTDSVTIEFKRKKLGWCRVNLVAAERDENGIVTSVVFAGNVVEKQKQKELAQQEALRAACESANIANAAKTNFLANMSHDIRTPMNAIIGMTAIAGTHLDDKERLSDCLSKISLSSKHLLGIINDVLDMSKIESGKIELQEGEFNFTELIDSLLVMSKPEVASKKHNLSVFVRNIEHENVIGDSQRIQQVFMNLMSNAVKYTPYGGKIKLTISEKQTNRPQVGCYEVIFEDNGIGMSDDFIAHIFEPFTRATDDERVEKIQGTGLGMSITKSIIQMMNGDIKVDSKLNEGTTFTVTLYLKLKNDNDIIDYGKFTNLPVLVVDDDKDACIYSCDLLKEIGMNGEWVLSGEEAVNKTVERHEKGNDYFAIILDWKMPGMNGVETTKVIRKRVGKDIPIIIISAYDWTDIELEARAAGANSFISKPMFKSRMIHVFNDLIGGDKEEKVSSELDELTNERFKGKRALLVEDNALNSEIAGEILGMAGFEIEYAINGKEAVDIMTNVSDGYFDVIFMDIQMPIMNGYEATRAIRSLPSNYAKSVPIFAMTANAFAEDVSMAKRAGMNEHIAKPMDFEQLTSTLKKWLD